MEIAFIGDSFVCGTGDPEYLGWVGRLCGETALRGYQFTIYNLGVRQDTSADIKKRWLRELSYRFQPGEKNHVVFSFGVNDTALTRGRPRLGLRDSLSNTYNILNVAKKSFPVLAIGPPPVANTQHNQRIYRLSEAFFSVCIELDIPYLDIFTPLRSSVAWMQEVRENDGIHPYIEGYAELADLVQNWSPWLSWFTANYSTDRRRSRSSNSLYSN
ncbi:MAG: GDSL-type esterase/lipase family protein [Cyanobacteria bacterium P01_E01_bin.42]